MQDLWWQLQDTDSFTVYTALAFAGAVCLFIYEVVGSPVMAVVSTPFLTAGGIVVPTLLAQHMITLSYEKTVNAVTGIALGTLAVLLLLLLSVWLWSLLGEFRVKRAKLVSIPSRPSRIRR
ncbi:MAG: hypothetical protein ABWZ86_06595 [Hyphomicrobium sp.]|jgi:hypothetical protein